MDQRYVVSAGTIRSFVNPNNPTDLPTFVRVDTKTGHAWAMELTSQGIFWVDVAEKGQQPTGA